MRLARLPSGEPEIFASIQGEGPSTGLPSTFVRLSLCNLRCEWCDTRYTWDWAAYDPRTEIIDLPVADVIERVERTGTTNIVFTGGEPLLQQDDLTQVAEALVARGRRIEVETNGTITPEHALAKHVAQWNVSPKLGNSGNSVAERERPDVLSWFRDCEAGVFKFVIAEQRDLEEVRGLMDRHGIPAGRVILMPEGQTPETIEERSAWLVPACIEAGYRFSTRLHVLLWGSERGR